MSGTTQAIVARRHRGEVQRKGEWLHFTQYDFGQGYFTVNLFPNKKAADWFIRTRVKHEPTFRGRVKFK